MSKAIICCSCSSVPNYCKKTYAILFPKTDTPPVYLSKKILPFADSFPKGSEVHDYLYQFGKRRGRFGYFIEWKDDGALVQVWNLLRSKKLL